MEKIYKEYSKYVFNYLISLTNNIELAEELMQDTFYSAIKNIHKFRNESSLKTWLCKIAKNKWLDYCKKNNSLQKFNIEEFTDNFLSIDSFEEEYIDREELIDFYKKIHNLDNITKEVIYLRIRGDFSFKEIGRIMEKSENWARITYYRAKMKLKEDLKNE